ncbi:MAG: 50S ribosomal protein L19 [Deltaproteobacteria bacterium]|nr:50S ribosomal protein L19 [Deltaproteobacteria bacterium]
MSQILDQIDAETQKRAEPLRYREGDHVKVHVKILEGSKERVQVFEGIIIARHWNGPSSTITVRKVSYGVGVERIFPVYSPTIAKIEWTKRSLVRRSKLYYLRKLRGKKARLPEVRDAARPEPIKSRGQ